MIAWSSNWCPSRTNGIKMVLAEQHRDWNRMTDSCSKWDYSEDFEFVSLIFLAVVIMRLQNHSDGINQLLDVWTNFVCLNLRKRKFLLIKPTFATCYISMGWLRNIKYSEIYSDLTFKWFFFCRTDLYNQNRNHTKNIYIPNFKITYSL